MNSTAALTNQAIEPQQLNPAPESDSLDLAPSIRESFNRVIASEDEFPRPQKEAGVVHENRDTIPEHLKVPLQKDHPLRIVGESLLALAIIVVTMPIMLAIALRIKTSSKGPALFFQERVGRDGKTFKFIKFRTMHVDARERFPELYAYKYDKKAIKSLKFKVTDDPRVTPEGAWLRKSSLDELPNFWNVVTGKMAIIGPRPEIPEMIKYYNREEMLEKFAVRPGVTGLAQASGRGNLGFFETVDYDVSYVQKRNFKLDVELFFKTVWGVLRRDGAF